MKNLPTFEEFLNEMKMENFPEYNNGKDTNTYTKDFSKRVSSVKGLESTYNILDSTSSIHIKSKPGMADVNLIKDIQNALKGFDNNLDLDSIKTNIGDSYRTSKNDQEKGIVSYEIPKKIDWWTLKRAAGPGKPSTETKLTPEIIDSLLDKMASASTSQHELADTKWTSLEDFLRAAKDHMNSTSYKKFYNEVKKTYPKIK
jgi:hypothetical protein